MDPIHSFNDADRQQFLCALQVHPEIHSFIFMGSMKRSHNDLNDEKKNKIASMAKYPVLVINENSSAAKCAAK